jgi:hypothetical protein
MSTEPKYAVRQLVGISCCRDYVEAQILTCRHTWRGWRYKVCFTKSGVYRNHVVIRTRSERRILTSRWG